MSTAPPSRPPSLLVAVFGSALVGVALIGLAVAALASGHGDFSGGVGLALLAYGFGILAAGYALWRGSIFGRGPVLAFALLNLIAGITFTASAPWVWLLVAVAAATVVAAALPTTSRALRFSRPDAPRPPDEPGS